ncbi:MAG: hypothetical protein KBH78_12405, partial [Candidatus Hydrogenedentes bacterium]|nr:hypothetical protein [Candidatus Hydrogenedentota bacterium]
MNRTRWRARGQIGWISGISPACCLALAITCMLAWGEPGPVPPKAVLALTSDQYEIRVHRDGTVSVVDGTESPLCVRALPAIELDDEKGVLPLKLNPREAQRMPARDILGEGPGLLIGGDNVQWQLVAYPGKPWLAARVAYVNTTGKP